MTHRWHWRKWLPERHGQLGGACPKDHSATPFDDFKGCTPCLRAELATEHKRQSAMRTLIASLEGQLMHYRSKQAEADEAVRTLDSERAANATLTAELAECKEDAERYRWLRNRIPGSAYRIAGIIYSEGGAGVDAGIDAARKGEGEV